MAFTLLNALNAFVAVARRRSFAAAGRDLGVSTSALSQSVRQLEARLGVTLLTRTSRSVALTDAGERLLAKAGPGVDQALESLDVVKAGAGEVTGRIRLTVPTVSVPMILSPILPRFVERYPGVELDVRIDDQLVKDPVASGFDAGIRLVESIDRDMVHVRLSGEERIVVVAAPAYLKRRGAPQKPEDLAQHDCLTGRLDPTGASWPWEFERGKKTWRVPVRGPVTTNSFELRRSLALAGVGLLYGMEAVVADDIARGRLRAVLEPYAPVVPGLFLYYPSRTQVSPALRAFVEVARELAARSRTKR
jgi:DNA-binding transcriptional LysR family regulator